MFDKMKKCMRAFDLSDVFSGLCVFLLVLLAVSLLFVAVEDLREKMTVEASDIIYIEDSKIRYYTDSETGVQYIIYREKFSDAGLGGITPRLNSDGSLYLDDVVEDVNE